MTISSLSSDRQITSIVFVDGLLPDLQVILSGLDPSVTAIVLDPAQDGIGQMAEALAGVSGLDAIHIISHGGSGQLNLGAAQLSQDTLAQYQAQLATIGNALSATGDLLLYGCNVAQGAQGQAFISALSNATGADVAASTDLTGASFLGGNWVLEANVGLVEATPLAATDSVFQSLLPTEIARSANYDIGMALDAAALSNLAYTSSNSLSTSLSNVGWTPLTSEHPDYVLLDAGGGASNNQGAYAFAATRQIGNVEQFAISFRGTIPGQNAIYDTLPHGFSLYYSVLRPVLEEALNQALQAKAAGREVQIMLTGHSLGGAAGYDHIQEPSHLE